MAIRERLGFIASKHSKLKDGIKLYFGDGSDSEDGDLGDFSFAFDGTDFDVLQATANSSIKWGVSGAGIDQVHYGDTVGADMTWDQSADTLLFGDNAKIALGTGSDATLAWDATDLDLTAAADDSVFKIGNGTNSYDLWIYGNTASDYVLWDASAGKFSLEGSAYQQLDSFRRTITAKTTDYTLVAADSGGVFTTTGAGGAVNFTLPAVATSTGFTYTFLNTVDQDMTVTAPAGTLVVFNNAAATSIAFSTASEKIGAGVTVVCDGAKWIAAVHLGAETQTPTIA